MDTEATNADSNAQGIAPVFLHRRHSQRVGLVIGCVAILLAAVFLYSRQNNFSSFYQPDEFEKARQLVTHKRLYLHPQLLLEGTELALQISGQRPAANVAGVRQVILTGRWVSAVFAGLAVTAFALIGYGYGGLAGFLLTALSVGLCPSILVNAHYMKEDTPLLFGAAMILLATFWYSSRPRPTLPYALLAFIGIAAGFAASGKYIGILILVPALWFISFPWEWPNALQRWSVVLASFGLTVLLINYSIFLDWGAFMAGLNYEINHALHEHFGGTVMNRPNSFALEALFRETMPHILVLAGAFVVALGAFWKTTTRWDLFLVLLAVGFSIILSFSIIPAYRYNLPLIALLHLMAALAVVKCVELVKRPLNWALLIAAIALIASLEMRRCINYLDQFANDSRLRLRSFVCHELPPGSTVIADAYALQEYDDDPRLTESESKLPVRFKASFWAADLSDFDALRDFGVDFVAVSEGAYGRFFDPRVRPSPNDTHFDARRRFYEQLFARGELVWSSDPEPPTHAFVNPPLRLYRVSGAR